ncbi:MAG: hypothetical protein HY900_05415, partial [Deltaproteobacteria bacterium]|nr:hypothetical protein [Deltaproteobacteria bacterium]
GVDVLGPAPAPIERLRNRFRVQVLLRAPGAEPGPVQALIRRLFGADTVRPGREVRIHADVDPVSFL